MSVSQETQCARLERGCHPSLAQRGTSCHPQPIWPGGLSRLILLTARGQRCGLSPASDQKEARLAEEELHVVLGQLCQGLCGAAHSALKHQPLLLLRHAQVRLNPILQGLLAHRLQDHEVHCGKLSETQDIPQCPQTPANSSPAPCTDMLTCTDTSHACPARAPGPQSAGPQVVSCLSHRPPQRPFQNQ